MTFAEAAIKILQEEGNPLHYQEITKRILQRGWIVTKGATPHSTLYAVMHLDEKQNREQSRFVKLKDGFFGLRDWHRKQQSSDQIHETQAEIVEVKQVKIPFFPKYSELKALLPIFENFSRNQINHFNSTITTLRGTPQSPVDWTNPDEWISERLQEDDQQLALLIWTQSEKKVNPRYIYGAWLLANSYALIVDTLSEKLALTTTGKDFVNHALGETEKFIDEKEGIFKILNIIAEKGTGKVGEFLSEWGDYLKRYSNFGTESTIKDTLRRRLDNLVDRQFLTRSGHSYSITEKGLNYIGASNHNLEVITVDKNQEIYNLIKQQEISVRESLQELIAEMNPYHFEHLIKDLLESMNYQNVKVTSPTNDKGVDVIADIEFGITSVREVVQVKRQKSNIQRTVLDALRGCLHRFGAVRGTIITTSNFSKGAENASIETGAAPITLINGEKLIDLLIQNEIGIRKKNLSILEIDEDTFIFSPVETND